MKYLKHIILILFIFSFGNDLFGQGWERKLSSYSSAYSAVQTPDEGFIVVGGGSPIGGLYILKIDASGKTDWINTYSDSLYATGFFVVELADKNYAVIGSGATGQGGAYSWIIKFDIFGKRIWSKEFSNTLPSIDLTGGVLPTADGGILIFRGSLNKISTDGELEWVKDYGPDGNDFVTGAAKTQEGGFVLTGWSGAYIEDKTVPFIIKINSLGIAEWTNLVEPDSSIGDYSFGYDLITQDNGYVVLGIDENPNGRLFLWKSDLAGSTKWYRSHKGNFSFKLVETTNKGFALTGFDLDNWLFLTIADSEGEEITRLFYNDEFDGGAGFDIIHTQDKGFFISAIAGNLTNQAYLIKTDSLGLTFTNAIAGRAAADTSQNCEVENEEYAFSNWVIKVEGEDYEFYGETDSLGNYFIETDTGNYNVNIIPINPYWQPCEDSIPVYFPNFFDTTQVDFPMEAVVDCPYLEVDITTPFLRRCSTSTYYVNYCNTGTISSDTPYIEITLDTFLNFLNSSIPLTNQNGNVYTFDLDTIGIGECGQFTIEVEVDCEAELGQTHCVEAHIYPDSLCAPAPSWSGGSIEVNGVCVNDTIHFSIKNTGNSQLSPGLNFIVIEDDVILYSGEIELLTAGGVQEVDIENIGATYRLEADQEPNHPGNSMPTFIIEGCGQGFTPGLVNQFPMDDADPFIDIDCRENVGSYDPNDKQAFPVGFEDEHFIEQNIDIEYLIRFQNTGTDTAFRVVIRDTLSSFLDVASVRPGASSHNYDFDISGLGILKFTFDNIMLPDSTANEPASQGFVKYRISQKENVPLGSVINNNAAIYFDFNAPVITNTTFHTVGEDFVPFYVSVNTRGKPELLANVFPNPFSKKAIVELKGINNFGKKTFSLFNSTGQLMQEFIFENNRFEINGAELNNGVYYFKINNEDGILVAGKVVVMGVKF